MTNWRYVITAVGFIAALASNPLLAQPATQPDAVPATQPVANLQVLTAQKVEAELRVAQPTYQLGQPVWVEFVLRNLTAEPLTLAVPNTLVAEAVPPAMGLPLAHVFSGPNFSGLQITRGTDNTPVAPVSRRPGAAAAPLVLGPYASVGVQVDAAKWYPALRQAGEYRLTWRPYGGLLASNPVQVKIITWKDVILHTDHGDLRIRLFYNKAPRTVEKFLELAGKGFYDNKTFHRVLPGFVIQGGSPTGDDTGVLPDNTRLKAEFNDTEFQRGILAMALAGADPDSASCQFFIALSRLPELDGRCTAFGELVGTESFDTLARLEQVELTRGPTGEKSRPVQPLRIQSVSFENAPRPGKLGPSGQPEVSPGLVKR